MLRRLIETAGDIQEMAYAAEDAVDETLDRAEAAIFEVAERRVADTLMPLYPALEETMNQLEALYDRQGDDRRYGHRLPRSRRAVARHAAVDAHDHRGASRPGKDVARARHGAARRAARSQAGAVLLDGDGLPRAHEASARGRGAGRRRASCRPASSPSTSGRRVNQAVGRLAEAPFFIDDNPHCTVMEMRAKARRIKARYGDLGLIVVDYLQLMSTPRPFREPSGRGVGAVAWSRRSSPASSRRR